MDIVILMCHLIPFAIICTDDNYDLLAFHKEKDEIRPFRVDRLGGVHVLKAYRRCHEAYIYKPWDSPL